MPAAKNKNKVTRRKRTVSPVSHSRIKLMTIPLIIGGIVLVAGGLVKQTNYQRSMAPLTAISVTQNEASNSGVPKKIIIGEAVNIPLDEAQLVGQKWTVSPVNGTYLLNSARLGQVGNMIIYGHNLKSIFGNLKMVETGDRVTLTDELGKDWTYRVVKTVVINPADSSWLQDTDIPMLTIYTCAGFMDSKRLIVRAVPVGKS